MAEVLAPPGRPVVPAAARAGDRPASPAAQRLARARWRDSRLLGGVLLVLVSVILGARFITSATSAPAWLSVTRPLPAGHVLTAADLTPIKAHLPAGTSRHYFTAAPGRLVGKALSRPLAAGELLPEDALATGSGQPSRVVPVVVKAGRLPALAPGDHVDVYVLLRGDGPPREVRVLTDVEFVEAQTLTTGESSVQLRVTPNAAISAIAASQSERVDLARVDRDSSANPGDPGPPSLPAYETG